MRVGQLCDMSAEFAFPQEGQPVLKHAGRAGHGDVWPIDALIAGAVSI